MRGIPRSTSAYAAATSGSTAAVPAARAPTARPTASRSGPAGRRRTRPRSARTGPGSTGRTAASPRRLRRRRRAPGAARTPATAPTAAAAARRAAWCTARPRSRPPPTTAGGPRAARRPRPARRTRSSRSRPAARRTASRAASPASTASGTAPGRPLRDGQPDQRGHAGQQHRGLRVPHVAGQQPARQRHQERPGQVVEAVVRPVRRHAGEGHLVRVAPVDQAAGRALQDRPHVDHRLRPATTSPYATPRPATRGTARPRRAGGSSRAAASTVTPMPRRSRPAASRCGRRRSCTAA